MSATRGRFEGKVALVTGAARGQGRAEAIKLAEEGAGLIITDLCASPTETDYEPASPEDLAETVASIERLDRRAIHAVADVRDLAALESLVAQGVSELGRLDIVVASSGR